MLETKTPNLCTPSLVGASSSMSLKAWRRTGSWRADHGIPSSCRSMKSSTNSWNRELSFTCFAASSRTWGSAATQACKTGAAPWNPVSMMFLTVRGMLVVGAASNRSEGFWSWKDARSPATASTEILRASWARCPAKVYTIAIPNASSDGWPPCFSSNSVTMLEPLGHNMWRSRQVCTPSEVNQSKNLSGRSVRSSRRAGSMGASGTSAPDASRVKSSPDVVGREARDPGELLKGDRDLRLLEELAWFAAKPGDLDRSLWRRWPSGCLVCLVSLGISNPLLLTEVTHLLPNVVARVTHCLEWFTTSAAVITPFTPGRCWSAAHSAGHPRRTWSFRPQSTPPVGSTSLRTGLACRQVQPQWIFSWVFPMPSCCQQTPLSSRGWGDGWHDPKRKIKITNLEPKLATMICYLEVCMLLITCRHLPNQPTNMLDNQRKTPSPSPRLPSPQRQVLASALKAKKKRQRLGPSNQPPRVSLKAGC